MKNPSAFIKDEPFIILSNEAPCTLNTLMKHWVMIKDTLTINEIAFNEHYIKYNLNQPDGYTDTRIKRFKTLIQKELILPFFEKLATEVLQTKKIELTQSIEQWLFTLTMQDHWQKIIHRRLVIKKQVLEGHYSHLLSLNSEKGFLNIKHLFKFNQQTPSEAILFQGESLHTLMNHNNELINQAPKGSLYVFVEELKENIGALTLDEKVLSHIATLANDSDSEEISILNAARHYYLNKLSSQELQQSFISTNIYSPEFKQSTSLTLIKEILLAKPIKGFSL